ncbi:uncharacterized protein SCHCODRAFT_02616855 [Schizophyllum commune H4-8]|uniref:uncharacterized protein n=1 Tax=Schizophyllum commune (strain H4-8 / FGSC 9210) TaxID=578458 RepID=UPI00215FBD0A|nr:uncharacterized protein SCHCODRAFT_02616851 [Schizophyllum commune H4-8]XP_050201880.1 uncharacterized protein SCHCODRAFT_02616855 [Schizophyllum commune H4-8]KAI5897159.1 hypothetical protein SCHCODRAFT_02616851 [Schizophyllum commune H4-8]KAI5897161.1 hypothetical protein SCHCODRAFT_02616855 [Schizophyllum commune H4-8]
MHGRANRLPDPSRTSQSPPARPTLLPISRAHSRTCPRSTARPTLVVARSASPNAATRVRAAHAADMSHAPPTTISTSWARTRTCNTPRVVLRCPALLVSCARSGSKTRHSANAELAPRLRSRACHRVAHPGHMPRTCGARRVAHLGGEGAPRRPACCVESYVRAGCCSGLSRAGARAAPLEYAQLTAETRDR